MRCVCVCVVSGEGVYGGEGEVGGGGVVSTCVHGDV